MQDPKCMRDDRRGMIDDRQMTIDEGRKMKDEGRRTKIIGSVRELDVYKLAFDAAMEKNDYND